VSDVENDDDNNDENLLTGNVSFQTLMSDLEKAHGENVNFYFPNNIFRLEEKEENSKYVFQLQDNFEIRREIWEDLQSQRFEEKNIRIFLFKMFC
jgi:hypothetical protein